MKNHTPGPWAARQVAYDRSTPFHVQDVDGAGEVAKCANKHDARLIAAAPELLAALEAIERDSEDELSRERARTAIKKVRGE